jgi:CRAL/TRIO domain
MVFGYSFSSSSSLPCKIETLNQCCPSSTKAECRRFLAHSANHAQKDLEAYLEWRKCHQLDNDASIETCDSIANAMARSSNDAERWQEAVQKAAAYVIATNSTASAVSSGSASAASSSVSSSKKSPSHAAAAAAAAGSTRSCAETEVDDSVLLEADIPQLAFFPSVQNKFRRKNDPNNKELPMTCSNGCRILHIFPARIQLHLPYADQLYATILSLYMDAYLDRYEYDKLTFLIDVRPGKGWPNPPADQMLSLIRSIVNHVQPLHPQRLHKTVLYPIPRPATWIWWAVKPFLGSDLRKSIVLLPGSAGLNSPVQVSCLSEHISDVSHVQLLEKTRLDTFEGAKKETEEQVKDDDSWVGC